MQMIFINFKKTSGICKTLFDKHVEDSIFFLKYGRSSSEFMFFGIEIAKIKGIQREFKYPLSEMCPFYIREYISDNGCLNSFKMSLTHSAIVLFKISFASKFAVEMLQWLCQIVTFLPIFNIAALSGTAHNAENSSRFLKKNLKIYRIIHKFFRDFATRLHNQSRHSKKIIRRESLQVSK